MPIKLNKPGYDHAMQIIKNGLEVEHDVGNWEAVKATPDEVARYLNTHTLEEYGFWFLGIDTDADPESKNKYVFPYGDLSVLHKSALIVAEQQATNKHLHEIKSAAQNLLAMIQKK